MDRFYVWTGLTAVAGLGMIAASATAAPTPAANAAFDAYVAKLEARLTRNHAAAGTFLADAGPENWLRMRSGEIVIDRVDAGAQAQTPGAMLHDWRAEAFVPGATVEDVERMLGDFAAYPQRFAPQVVTAKVVARDGDWVQAAMRMRQHHVITVVMDADYDVRFGRLDTRHGYSISRSTRIAEISGAGTAHEHALSASEEHGFLWRMNTYWGYEERDGGVALEVESISLTRAIPAGLGWAVRPFVESVPRESLEFTLSCARKALAHEPVRGGE